MTARAALLAALTLTPIVVFALDAPTGDELLDMRRELTGAEGERRVELLNRLAFALKSNSPGECLELAAEALELATTLGYEAGQAQAHRHLGIAHYYLGEYDLALEQYQLDAEISRRIGDRKGVADASNNIGILYYVWGMSDEALQYYLEALTLRRELGDPLGEAWALNNIAAVHQSIGHFDEALVYYRQSLELYEELSELPHAASTLDNIGLVLLDTDRLDEALDHFTRALEILEDLEDSAFLANTLHNIGMAHDRRGELEAAIGYFRRALTIRESTGDRQGQAATLTRIAVALGKQGALDEARSTVEAALDLATRLNMPEVLRDAQLAASDIYDAFGDSDRALALYRAFKETNDLIFDRDRARTVAELQTRYEVEGKDLEIAMLRRTQEFDRTVRNIVFLVAGLLVVIVFLVYNRYRLGARARRTIEARNRALEEAQSELELALRSQLTHVSRVATMGELAAGFAHELNQPLAAIQSNARISRRLLEVPDDEILAEVREALTDIGEGAERAAEIIKRLRELIRRGDVSVEELDVNEIIRGVERLILAEAGLAHIPVRFELAAHLPNVFADRIQLQQVVLNLVQNGVAAMASHPIDDAELVISTRFNEDQGAVVVAVLDCGPPLADEVIKQMFDPFFTTKPEGLGMGLRISRTIVEAHNGRLWAEKNRDRGLTVQFSIPVEQKRTP